MYPTTDTSSIFNTNNGSKFVSLIYAFSPILVIYKSPVSGLAINEFIISVLFVCFSLTKPEKLFRVNSLILPLIIYICYGICLTIGVILTKHWSQPDIMIYDLFSKLLFFTIFLVGVQFISFSVFFKYIVTLADISVAFLLFQFVLSLGGLHISGIIPFLNLSNEVDTAQFISGQLESDRMSSFFSEPAHLSEFLLLPFAIECFRKNKNNLRILLYGISIIMSKSTSGFSVLGVILIFFLFHKLKSIKRKSMKIVMSICIILLSTIVIPYFLILFGDTIDRFSEISGDANGLFSGYIRVTRGYVLFGEYSLTEKILGQGFGCILGYITSHKTAYLDLTDKIPEYVNSIQYLLITTGIIGLMLIAKFVYGIFVRCSSQFKMVLIVLVVMMTSSSIFFSTIGCLYLIVSIKSINFSDCDRRIGYK